MDILHISSDETKKMTSDEKDGIITYLVLKYGSMDQAFIAWMVNHYDIFSPEEHDVILAYEQEKYPNLKLVHRKVDKPD